MHDDTVVLYVEFAAVAMAIFFSFEDPLLMELVRLKYGFEENPHALKEFYAEDDDDFQFREYEVCVFQPQARWKGMALAPIVYEARFSRFGLFLYVGW